MTLERAKCEDVIARIDERIVQLKSLYLSSLDAVSRMTTNEFALFCSCVGETPTDYVADVAKAVIEFERVVHQDMELYINLGVEAIESDLRDFEDLLCVLSDLVGGISNTPILDESRDHSERANVH